MRRVRLLEGIVVAGLLAAPSLAHGDAKSACPKTFTRDELRTLLTERVRKVGEGEHLSVVHSLVTELPAKLVVARQSISPGPTAGVSLCTYLLNPPVELGTPLGVQSVPMFVVRHHVAPKLVRQERQRNLVLEPKLTTPDLGFMKKADKLFAKATGGETLGALTKDQAIQVTGEASGDRVPLKAKLKGKILEGWAPKASVGAHELAYRSEPEPLTPKGLAPKAGHVVQGSLGTCFLLAPLAALAALDPDGVQKLFRAPLHEKGTDDLYVRFHAVSAAKPPTFKEASVRVQRTLPHTKFAFRLVPAGGRVYAHGPALWPAFVEKAYAAWEDSESDHDGSKSADYASGKMTGGHSWRFLQKLTGKRYEAVKVSTDQMKADLGALGSGKYGAALNALFARIQSAIAKKRPMALATPQLWDGIEEMAAAREKDGGPTGEAKALGLLAKHQYGVVGARVAGKLKLVKVRNPWGRYGRAYDRKKTPWARKVVEGAAGADFEVELSDVARHFEDIALPLE